jgi:hypothetical protein
LSAAKCRSNKESSAIIEGCSQQLQSLFTYQPILFLEKMAHIVRDACNRSAELFMEKVKLIAEQCVKESGLPFAIVRPVFIYGPVWEGVRSTFLHWVKTALSRGKAIKVVSDQTRTPTFVTDICKGIEAYHLIQAVR